MPTCEPYRPVRNATRLGEQTGVVTKALLNLTPSRASRSMFGVIDFAVAVRANGPERLIVGDDRDEIDFEVGGSLRWRPRLSVDLAVLPPHLSGHRLHALGFAGRQIALFTRIGFQVVEFVFGKARVRQQLPIARAQGDFGHRQVVVRSGDGVVVLPIERCGTIERLPLQQRAQADAVNRTIGTQFDASQIAQRRQAGRCFAPAHRWCCRA